MNNGFDIGELARLAQNLLNKTDNGKEFMLEHVHNLTRAAYEKNPEDPVIRQVSFVVEGMCSRSPKGSTINQRQISNIYNEFVRLSENNKFREVLGFLLPEQKLEKVANDFVRLNREESNSIDINDLIGKEIVDTMSAAVDSASKKPYDSKLAQNGISYVKAELSSIGFKNVGINILGGDNNNLVYAANFDTTKGKVSVAIPVQIVNCSVTFPTNFLADDHLEELSYAKLNSFINTKANVSSDHDNNINVSFNKLNGQEIRQEINTPKVEMPKELVHLAHDFENNILEAASVFGIDSIRKGKEIIAKELIAAGFKGVQVKFGNESNKSVVYSATIPTKHGNVNIDVPIEMQSVGRNFIPLSPTQFAYNEMVEDFTAEKLNRFAMNLPEPSSKNVVYSSLYSYMTLPELKQEIIKSASKNDYANCENILEEIQDKFSSEDYKNAVADYHFVLKQKSAMEQEKKHVCSKLMKTPNSLFEVCGHYLVPISQVITDEFGNCRLKTSVEKEKLNPIKETGASISTSKIILT